MDEQNKPALTRKASVWIIDDNDPYCYILAQVINNSNKLSCDKYFLSAKSALDELAGSTCLPKVILLDITMPGLSGLDAIRYIHQISSGIIIIMLTSLNDENEVRLALKRGARGYILKISTDEDILRSIEQSLDGGMPLDPKVTRTLIESYTGTLERTGDYDLSPREQDVIKLVTQGLKSKDAAKILCISHHTVETHLRNIYNKLNVTNRLAMVAKVTKEGLV